MIEYIVNDLEKGEQLEFKTLRDMFIYIYKEGLYFKDGTPLTIESLEAEVRCKPFVFIENDEKTLFHIASIDKVKHMDSNDFLNVLIEALGGKR